VTDDYSMTQPGVGWHRT